MWVGIIWSAISAVGLGYYISLFTKARGDVQFLCRNNINSIRLAYANMRARFYLGLGIIQCLYVAIGVLYTADPTLHLKSNTPRGDAAIITRSLFFLASIILAVLAVYTDRLRSHVVDLTLEKERVPSEREINDGDS